MTTERVSPRASGQRDTLDLTVRHASLPSADAAYVDEGDGPPIVLLHGAPLTSLGFSELIRYLRPHCRVVAPDFPGFGGSMASDGFVPSLAAYADFVVELCETLDLTDLTLFVHDSSGPIGLAAAAALSERLSGLVVADTVPIPLTGRARIVRPVLRHIVTSGLARRINRRTNALAWLVANVAPMHRRLPRRTRAAMAADFADEARRERILDVFGAMATDTSFLRRTADAIVREAARIPALILYGQFDPMRFVGGPSRYRKMFPDSKTVIVPLEEHFPMLGSAEKVAAAIVEWMASRSSTRRVTAGSLRA